MIKKITLTQGYTALIDDKDFELISQYRWHVARRRKVIYANTSYGNHTPIMMHRLILGAKPGQVIDHIDGNGLNNQRSNLRFCTYSQNFANRGSNRGSRSRFKGVCWDKEKQRWRARIGVNYKKIRLGSFCDESAAAGAYNTAALKYFGEFAKLNKIEGD